MINNVEIAIPEDGINHSVAADAPPSKKSLEASPPATALSKLATQVSSTTSSFLPAPRTHQHHLSVNSVDPLLRAIGDEGNNAKNSNGIKALKSPSSSSASLLKPFPVRASANLTPTSAAKDPFNAIYNNPGSWSQGAFVTAAHKRKKAGRLRCWLAVALGVLLLIGVSLSVFFCYPRTPSVRVTSITRGTDVETSMFKLQSNPALASFNFSMSVRIQSPNYLATTISDLTCFGYHPLQPVTVIATSSPFQTIVVPPQAKTHVNASVSISLVTPTTSAAVFTGFLAGCGLVGINSSPSTNATTAVTSNDTNVPKVVDRPRNRLLFRCTTLWTVGATTRQTEFDSSIFFSCPVHFESMPDAVNRTFVFSS